MLKGGFGLIDAPNQFKSRVDEVCVANGAKPTCSEPKIYLRMSGPNDGTRLSSRGGSAASGPDLILMVSAHMDDFKATGPQSSLDWTRDILSKAFGGDVQMEQDASFIHTGIRHTKVEIIKRTSSTTC